MLLAAFVDKRIAEAQEIAERENNDEMGGLLRYYILSSQNNSSSSCAIKGEQSDTSDIDILSKDALAALGELLSHPHLQTSLRVLRLRVWHSLAPLCHRSLIVRSLSSTIARARALSVALRRRSSSRIRT